ARAVAEGAPFRIRAHIDRVRSEMEAERSDAASDVGHMRGWLHANPGAKQGIAAAMDAGYGVGGRGRRRGREGVSVRRGTEAEATSRRARRWRRAARGRTPTDRRRWRSHSRAAPTPRRPRNTRPP